MLKLKGVLMKLYRNCLPILLIASFLFISLNSKGVSAISTEPQPGGTILYVKPGAEGDCLSWATACDLQTALHKGIAHQIWVAKGTYTPVPATETNREVSFELISGVWIYGGFPSDGGDWEDRDWEANPTTLSGEIGNVGDISDNSYHVVSAIGVNYTARLDGFTITGGGKNVSTPPTGSGSGGGMYSINSSPTLSNLIFTANSSYRGAGMYNENSDPSLTNVIFSNNESQYGGGMANYAISSPTLSDVTFSGNSSASFGGGIYNDESSPTLTDVTFSGNSSGRGGGIYNDSSSPILTAVIFDGNTAISQGGGMANYYNSSPILTDVTFIENTSSWGGGMFNIGSSPTLNAVTFSGNSVNVRTDGQGGWGGGLANAYLANPSLTNVTFSANSAEVGGGGMYNEDLSNPQLTNVTFFGNSAEVAGGGIYNGLLGTNASNSELTNTIVWANSPDQIFNQAGSTTTVTYSVIQGDSIYPGEGNINADPLLQPQADNGVFTFTHALGAGSSAIDTGSPVGCPVIDQRGFPRPVDGDGDGVATCDIGAFEYYHQVFLPLIMSD